MTIRNQRESMTAGDDKIVQIAVTDADNDSAPVNLTGGSAKFALFEQGQATPIFTKTSGAGQIAFVNIAGTNDGVEVTLLPADTSALGSIRGTAYDMEAETTTSAGKVDTVMTGTLTIYANRLA